MLKEDKVVKKDIDNLIKEFPFDQLVKNQVFLVTGATGLIGSLVTVFLSENSKKKNLNTKILATGRNKEKFEKISKSDNIHFIETDIENLIIQDKLDYIIHCAAPTSSNFYVDFPIKTISTIINGTQKVLELAKLKNVKSFVNLSSLEVYGENYDNKLLLEHLNSNLNPSSTRSSYPLSKAISELLVTSYYSERQLPAKNARLTQVFGPGISKEENRVFAQFARAILLNEDITIHTKGKSAKPYCYTTDAILGIFYILFKGENGHTYNVANQKTYISIYDLAQKFIELNPNQKIIIEEKHREIYPPDSKLNLDTSKIEKLGWNPKIELNEMIVNLTQYLNEKF